MKIQYRILKVTTKYTDPETGETVDDEVYYQLQYRNVRTFLFGSLGSTWKNMSTRDCFPGRFNTLDGAKASLFKYIKFESKKTESEEVYRY